MEATEELVRRAAASDGDAFVELMEIHKASMYKIARAYLHSEEDAADAMAETVLSCFEHLSSLKEPQYFKTWLVRILINNCKNILRKNSGLSSLEEAVLAEEATSGDEREFLDYLTPLSADTRKIMILYYMWGFRTREIAELTNSREGTVKSKLLRGREKIRQVFFPETEQEGLG